MEHTKDGSNARAEKKEPCGQHSFSHWVLMRLHMVRKTERDRSKQSRTRRICPPTSLPSFPAGPLQQAQIAEDRILHYNKAGYKVLEKVEDNRWDTQTTEARRQIIMWTVLFFLLGFDEVAHDTGRRKGQTLKDKPYASSPPILLKKLLASTLGSIYSTSFRTAVIYLY